MILEKNTACFHSALLDTIKAIRFPFYRVAIHPQINGRTDDKAIRQSIPYACWRTTSERRANHGRETSESRTRDERITAEGRANHGRWTNEPRTRDERFSPRVR